MEIPYVVESRADTGVNNSKLGIWMFLASEVILFGALFSALIVLRMSAGSWPVQSDILSVPIGALNTAILIGSSITMIMAWASLKQRNFKNFKIYMGATILLAFAFLIIKIFFEYIPKYDHGYYPSTNNFFALYYVITALHGLHRVGGIIVNSYFWGPGSKLWKENEEWFTNRIEIAGLYWHFVDLVWIFLFPVLYLI